MDTQELAALRSWLAWRLRAEALAIEDVRQHAEGFSWETYTFTASWRGDRGSRRQGFALRREPAGGLLPPYDAARDHRLHAAVAASSEVPVPALRWLEVDPDVLGRPFYLMDRVEGIVPVPWAADDPRVFPDEDARHRIGEEFIDVLARIHDVDVDASGIAALLGDAPADPDAAALAEVHRWADVAEASWAVREPVLDRAVIWLERNVATSGRRALVHGDYRLGNFMVGPDGHISAVFDWELAHIGDPAFDLAWANLRLYRGRSPLMSRLLPLDEALARYARRTGLHVEADVLRWWTVFGLLRAIAPHLRAARAFEDGATGDVRLANMGHRAGHLLKLLAEELGLPRRAPRDVGSREADPDQPDQMDAADQPDRTDPSDVEEDDLMMHNSPARLLRGAAAAVREVVDGMDDPDPWVRAQLAATAELMATLSTRVEWRAEELAEQVERVRTALRQAVAEDTGHALGLAREVLATPPAAGDVDALLEDRRRHMEALREVQAWAADHGGADVQEAVASLLGWHLEVDLHHLRAGAVR